MKHLLGSPINLLGKLTFSPAFKRSVPTASSTSLPRLPAKTMLRGMYYSADHTLARVLVFVDPFADGEFQSHSSIHAGVCFFHEMI